MKLYKAFLGLYLAVGLLGGCTDRFDSMNTDPSTVSEANLKYVLPYVQEKATHINATDVYQLSDNLYAQKYCQYFANKSTSFPTDRYGYNDSWSSSGFWTPYYLVLKHMKVAKNTAEANPEQTDICQMIRIITAWNTIGMTDCFGDIPYFEAGLGNSQNAYDSQESIYQDVFNELTDAVNILKQGLADQETCGSYNDLIFDGDTEKWIRFANSLRLRCALRISFVDSDWAQEEGEAALASGVMQSNDDNAYMLCSGTGDYGWGHPLYMIDNWSEFCMSKKMEQVLTSLSTVEDPRLELWFGVTQAYGNAMADGTLDSYTGQKWVGLANGLNVTELGLAENDISQLSCTWGLQAYPDYNLTGVLVDDLVTLPFKVMTYSEVCLLKAEAALRGWSGAGDAQQNYEEGIRASFEDERSFLSDQSVSSTANDDTYITTGDVAWNESDSFEQKLEKIITQKWIAIYPSGIEAWAECRRTGYPELIPVMHSEDADIDPSAGEFIKKIRYIDSERRENAANATASTLNQGQGDGSTVRVWWDTGRYN